MAALEEQLSEEEYRKERREEEQVMMKQEAMIWELKEKFAQQDLKKCLQENYELQETVQKLQEETEALKAQTDTGEASAKFLLEKDELQKTVVKLQNQLQARNELQRIVYKLQSEKEVFKDKSDIQTVTEKCLQEKAELQESVEKLQKTVNKLKNEIKFFRDQRDTATSMQNFIQGKADLHGRVGKLQNKMKGLEGQEHVRTAFKTDLEQEHVGKEKLEAIIIELVKTGVLNENILKVEQEISPADVREKIHELENSLASEKSKCKVNEEDLNDLRQEVNKLQEELHLRWKMYEHFENKLNEMITKVPGASATEADRKTIKDLESEVQHLKDKNRELAYELEAEERKMSTISRQTDELNKEENEMADTNKHALQGKMKINP